MRRVAFRWQVLGLLALTLVVIGLFMTYKTYGNWSFALAIRGRKLGAFILVSIAASFTTITFQTLTHNRFLTPGTLGIDQLYVVIQTAMFFVIGGANALANTSLWQFLLNVLLMSLASVAIILFFLGKSGKDFFRLLMVGMVSSSLLESISTFLQVLMDPNEYDLLQGRLYASFGNVAVNHLVVSFVLLLVICGILWHFAPELNVMQLGFDQGVNLGLAMNHLQRGLLFLVAAATGIATALVGPTIFLGFIIVTIGYEIFQTGDHRKLFLGCSLLGVILLVLGQFFVEQVLGLRTTIGTVIQFAGGLFFVGKLMIERKKA